MKKDESIPRFSDEYLESQVVFYRQFNDIDIFVEDVDQEDFYKEILSKILPYKIGKVFPLRGKTKVIERAQKSLLKKRRIFIVDKDFDDLHGNIVSISNLFYLKKYSIENFLISKQPILFFLKEECPKIALEQIEAKLKFELTVGEAITELTELTSCFFLAQSVGLPISNSSLPIERFLCGKTHCKVDINKCNEFYNEIQLYCDLFGITINLEEEKNKFLSHYTGFQIEPHVPGKQLLALFLKKLVQIFEIKRLPNKDSLCYRLARNSNFENLIPLRDQIKAYCTSRSITTSVN